MNLELLRNFLGEEAFKALVAEHDNEYHKRISPKFREVEFLVDEYLKIFNENDLKPILFSRNGVIHLELDENKDLSKLNEHINLLVERLVPWRKGPFNLYGKVIESQWRSDLKWDRVSDLVDLKGKVIADIGSNNGYYIFRMLEQNPKLVFGFDPVISCYLSYKFLTAGLKTNRASYALCGYQCLDHFNEVFDVVFCMGIIYHHKSPYEILEKIKKSLSNNGTLVLESMIIPGEESQALIPAETYGRAKNVFFLPTVNALLSMLKKTGFRQVEVNSISETSVAEQRRTEYSPYGSIEDFLDPSDNTKTVEGYPAPLRAVVIAKK